MKFIIWWDGPDKEKISKFIQENNLSKNIFLVWYIQDMVSFYNMIDCFVFPSHRESMWLTWLEANACWCPVVASDIPWLNEVMIDWKNALLFEKWNFNDLFQNLLKIQKDKHLVSQLEIQENFTSNIYFEKLNWIYES
jgi:glycosyltransferase involved in cell wall biosynthesis